MDKQGKIWGETTALDNHNNVEVHFIRTQKGGYSSKHKHNNKFNKFYIVSGVLAIERWKDYGLVDTTILTEGDTATVPPGEFHRFRCIEDALAIEIYWSHLDTSDIVREDQGGIEEK